MFKGLAKSPPTCAEVSEESGEKRWPPPWLKNALGRRCSQKTLARAGGFGRSRQLQLDPAHDIAVS